MFDRALGRPGAAPAPPRRPLLGMPRFTAFAVVGGAGRLGSQIVSGLLAQGGAVSVAVLTQNAGASIVEGAELRVVDYSSVESLVGGLAGVEVTVSALTIAAARDELNIARAAKAAGARLHVPNEFSIRSAELPYSSPLGYKREVREWLTANDLPALYLSSGVFLEAFCDPRLGIDFANRQIEITGSLDVWYSFTAARDVGTFLGSLLTRRSTSELLTLGDLVIQGDRIRIGDIVRLYEDSHPGTKLELTLAFEQPETVHAEGAEDLESLLAWLRQAWAQGKADLTEGGAVELENWLVPEWEPCSVREYLAQL